MLVQNSTCWSSRIAEVLKVTDDSMSGFPRVWRKNDGTPNAASVPQEDVTKGAPTTKHLGSYPSDKHTVVGPVPQIAPLSHVYGSGHAGGRCGQQPWSAERSAGRRVLASPSLRGSASCWCHIEHRCMWQPACHLCSTMAAMLRYT